MSIAESNLSVAASKLAHAAPGLWDEFVAAFHSYSESIKDEYVQAPAADLPRAQGRAQQAIRTHVVLKDCRTTAAKVVTAQQASNSRRP